MGIDQLLAWEAAGQRWRSEHREVHQAWVGGRQPEDPLVIEDRECRWRDLERRRSGSLVGEQVVQGADRYRLLSWLDTVTYWTVCPGELAVYDDLLCGADVTDAQAWLEREGFMRVWAGELLPGRWIMLMLHPDGMLAEVLPSVEGSTLLWEINIRYVAEPVDAYALYGVGGAVGYSRTDTVAAGTVRVGRLTYHPPAVDFSTTGSLRVALTALRTFGQFVTPWPRPHFDFLWLGGEPGAHSRRACIEATDALLRSLPALDVFGTHLYDKNHHLRLPRRVATTRSVATECAWIVAQRLTQWAVAYASLHDVTSNLRDDSVAVLATVLDRQARRQELDARHIDDLDDLDIVAARDLIEHAHHSLADSSDPQLWNEIFGDATILADYPQLRAPWVSAIDTAATTIDAHIGAVGEQLTLTVGQRWANANEDS